LKKRYLKYCQKLYAKRGRYGTTVPNPECLRDFGITVFDVEPFGHELPSGLSLRVEDKAEWLRRNEKYSVVSK
jgi:hypothetical protein